MMKALRTRAAPLGAILGALLLSGLDAAWGVSAGQAHERQNAVVQAVRRVSPAVVNISSEIEVVNRVNPFSGFTRDPFFDSFFKDFFDPGFTRRHRRSSLGSGVIIDGEQGFILTNAHVIARAGKITVVLNDEREFAAQLIGADPESDLAVLRISAEDPLPSIPMGTSADVMIGETVIAIGNPFGFSHTVTTGVISALDRSLRTEDRVFHNFMQTDASINPGNSGGPLLNIDGELIGINTAIYAKAQGIGFAIPIDKARKVIADLIQYGEVVQSWIGLTVQDIDERLARYLGTAPGRGVLVRHVDRSSPAHAAGVREGAVLRRLNGEPLRWASDYNRLMRQVAPGDKVELTIIQGDDEQRATVEARLFPRERARELAFQRLGIRVAPNSPDLRRRYDLATTSGVVIREVAAGSDLRRIGVRPGDVLRQIDDIVIDDMDAFDNAIIKYRQKHSLVLLVQRGERGYYITVDA